MSTLLVTVTARCVICGEPKRGRNAKDARKRQTCGLPECASTLRGRRVSQAIAEGRLAPGVPDSDPYADRWAARSRELIAQGIDRDRAHVLAARELMGA